MMKLRYNKEEFASLVIKGRSYNEIADEYGISYDATRQRVLKLKRAGYIPKEFDARQRNGRRKKNNRAKMTKEEFIEAMLKMQRQYA